jgi:hypothetical protein
LHLQRKFKGHMLWMDPYYNKIIWETTKIQEQEIPIH